MRRFGMAMAGVIAAGAFVIATGGPAFAKGELLTLTCGQDTVVVETNGNGTFTPGRDADSTRVLHPTSFGPFTGTFTPNDGSDPFEVNDPPLSRKTVPANGRPLVTCTFHISFTDENGSFVGDGSVTGWASGPKK